MTIEPSAGVRVSCVQLAPDIAHGRANEPVATAAIEAAFRDGAQIVVLPELATSGYVFESTAEARSLALDARADLFESWRLAASRVDGVVIAGFPESGADGTVYNSAVLVDSDGVRAVYRKTHLWDEEKNWFAPGGSAPPVVETRFGRIGLLICYDLEFPEMARSLAIRGADLIAVPTNWPVSRRPESERPPEMIDASSAARLNGVFVACCDRSGVERGVVWTGGSCIIDTDGWFVAELPQRDTGVISAELPLGRSRDKTLNAHNDLLGDRRPDLYGELVKPAADA